MLLLCLLLACKPDIPPESGDTGDCALWCPDLDGDGLGDLVFAECWPVHRCAPPVREECNFTTNCPE